MTYVALALVAGWAATSITLLGAVRAQWRQHARERDLLLNQLLHATGKPWQAAPADDKPEPAPREPRSWTATPEQQPLY